MGRRTPPGPTLGPVLPGREPKGAPPVPPGPCGRGRSKIGLPRCMPPSVCAAPAGAVYTGRGPVCGIIMRLAGGPGTTAGVALAAGVFGAAAEASEAGADAEELSCSCAAEEFPKVAAASATFGGVAAETAPVGLPIKEGAALPKAVPCFVSCATPLPGVWTTTGEPVVKPDAGGFTITGPEGGREAIAGRGGVVTICGACLGNGTTLRGAGG